MKSLLIFLFGFLWLSNSCYAQSSDWDDFEDLIVRQHRPNEARLWLIKKLNKSILNDNVYDVNRCFNSFLMTTSAMEDQGRQRLFFQIDSLSRALPKHYRSITQMTLMNQLANRSWLSYRLMSKPVIVEKDTFFIENNKDLYTFIFNRLELIEKERDGLEKVKLPESFSYFTGDNISLPTAYDFVSYELIRLYSSYQISRWVEPDFAHSMESSWLETPDVFKKVKIDPSSLFNRTISLYQDLERLNASNRTILAQFHYLRLKQLKIYFVAKDLLPVYQKAFKFYHDSPLRSQFLLEIAALKYRDGLNYHFQNAPENEPLIKEAYELLKGEKKQFPKSNVTDQIDEYISMMEKPQLQVSNLNHLYPKSNIPLKLSYRNIDSVDIYVIKEKVRNPQDNYELFQSLGPENYSEIYKKSLFLPNKNMLQNRSKEMMLPAISSPGNYILLVLPKGEGWKNLNRDKNNWGSVTASYSKFLVTEITVAIESTGDETKLIVTDYKTGKPIKNAKVDVFYSRFTEILEAIPVKRGSTDDNGFFHTELKNYQSYTCRVRYKDSEILINGYFSNYKNNAPSHLAAIFTDRSIYRPGQKLHYKAIEYLGNSNRNEFKVIENKKLEVKLYDANYQLIASEEKQANQFGSISGSFDLPTSGLLGRYSIQVNDEKGTHLNTHSFTIEEYKRPTFQVNMENPKNVVKLGDSISVYGDVKAFAGFPLSDVNVRYSVYREPTYFWWYRPMGYSNNSELMQNGEVKTDEQGRFEVEFFASAESKLKEKDFNFRVQVDVTDLSGETQTSSINIRISETGLFLNHNGPESYVLGEKVDFEIKLQNAFGENQAPQEGKIILYRKKEQIQFLPRIWAEAEYSDVDSILWNKLFPYRKSKYLNIQTENDLEDNVFVKAKEISFITHNSIDINELFAGMRAGSYKMKAVVFQSEDSISMTHQINFINDEDSSYKKGVPLWVQNNQLSAKVGDAVTIRFGSGFEDPQALVEIYSGKKLVSSAWQKVSGTNRIKLTIKEEDRGGMSLQFLIIKNGIRYYQNVNIDIPYDNKKLSIETLVFRDQLYPGQEEEWSFKIKDHLGKIVESEVLASMYDASLDEFKPHSFSLWPYFNTYHYFQRSGMNNQSSISSNVSGDWRYYYNYIDDNSIYGGVPGSYSDIKYDNISGVAMRSKSSGAYDNEDEMMESAAESNEPMMLDYADTGEEKRESDSDKKRELSTKQDQGTPQIRKNFNETAFFYPHLKTDDKGEILVSFKLPESLTKWNFKAFAHTKGFSLGSLNLSAVAQKDLMIAANAPRFYRRGDRAIFSSRLTNLSENNLDVNVELTFFNPVNDEEIKLIQSKNNTQKVNVSSGGNKAVEWQIDLKDAPDLIAYKIVAKTKGFSDGEQKMIPVLSNRQFVTEAFPFVTVGEGTHSFSFEQFKQNNSKTLSNHNFSLEYTANPIWNVVLALPYMTDYPYECSEQVFTRFFANTLAAQVIGSKPELQKTLEIWKTQNPEVFISELNKNEELKSILLKETPWLVQAQTEEEQRKKVIELFDMNSLKNNLDRSLALLKQKQNGDGGFGWFGGNRSNLYITQHIISGFGYLKHLGINFDASTDKMIYKAIAFTTNEHLNSYRRMTKEEQKNLTVSRMSLHWLYTTSFFEINKNSEVEEMLMRYDSSLKSNWMQFGLQEQSLAGIYFKRSKNNEMADLILYSLQDRSKFIKNKGLFFPENNGGYYWYGDKIGTHAMLLTFFNEMEVPQEEIEELRLWLLMNKRSNHWGHTKNTAMATYAMLLTGNDFTSDNSMPKIKIGGKNLTASNSTNKNSDMIPFLGYLKHSWNKSEITKDLSDLTIEKTTSTPSYGALYWQYFEDIDKIQGSSNPDIDVNRKYELIVAGQKGKEFKKSNTFNIGDRIRVTLTFETQNDLEYVHLKDLRPSGFEPLENLSRHHWDQGLWYYQSPKDASMNFFIDRLPRGSYTLTYEVFATAKGSFSAGNTTIQCMYAPEMVGHSKGENIDVGN